MAEQNDPIRALIVDDEAEACINLRNILTEYIDPGIDIVGIAHNTKQAERLLHKFSPNAVFLDIEMPNENAFHFLQRISPFNFEVIFVTAYDEYAIKAFKLNAVDYILKPISISELTAAVKKLKERFEFKKIIPGGHLPYGELSAMVNERARSQKIILKDSSVIEVVDFKDIFFVEAQGSYSRFLFFKDAVLKEMTMSGCLADYEDLFPDDLFYRIHKSYLINCSFVKKIARAESMQVFIGDNYSLPVSRRRTIPLIEFLKNNGYYHE